jgi:membrane protease YdiL (CAAX protease family)
MQNVRQKTLRNLIIFVVVSLVFPWLGWGLDVVGNQNPHNQQGSFGWLFFLVSPLVISFILRAFGGDGWQDIGLNPALWKYKQWYLFSLFFHPFVTGIILLLGMGIGMTILPDLSSPKYMLVGEAMVVGLFPTLLKNIFEEVAWRGYLAPKIQIVINRPLIGYIITGMVWFGWHLPYYLVLLDAPTIRSFTSFSLGLFLCLTLLSLVAASIVYGEIRQRTNSFWPAFLSHTIGNMLISALITQAFYWQPTGFAELGFSPGWTSLLSILLFTGAGLWLYQSRMNMQKEKTLNASHQ